MTGFPVVLPAGADRSTLGALRQRYETELFDRVLPFWERHSPDPVHGGTFNNLDRDGTVYDRTKHVWLMGRQAWMFSTLYRTVQPRAEWLALARSGVEFLREHAVRDDGLVYFHLARDGAPIYRQRKLFSECFTALALAEHGRAADRPALLHEAEALMERIFGWAEDPAPLGRPQLAGQRPAIALAVPMILLNLIEEIAGASWRRYAVEVDRLLARVRKHVHNRDGTVDVRETVAPDGDLLDGPDGRLLNPGHAIEAGWFVQHWAQRLGDADLSQLATRIVADAYRRGWDAEHGGLFYFLDAEGHSPTQLEWSMKLWWPHCEALYGHLLGASLTGSEDAWEAFRETDRYTFEHFPDPEHGEWFGYLDREGRVTHRFKGGPYKGCFHVPRALLLCVRRLAEMEDAAETPP
ncbi:MAG: AGE family epimerase/isomerase [Bacteroidota bacterium]